MVCPNCQSHDFIAVQGQLFCVACGRLTTSSDVKAEPSAAVSAPVQKRAPGRPRAVGLDTPRRPAAAPVKPASIAIAHIASRSLSDIRPVQPRPDAAVTKPVRPLPTPPRPQLSIKAIMGASLRSLHPLWIVLALPGAALVAMGLVLGVWDAFYLGAVMTPLKLSLREIGELIAALGFFVSGLGWLRLTRAAAIFHRAGVYDHRLAGNAVSWLAAMSWTPRLMGLRLRHGLAIAVDLGLLGALVWYGGRPGVLPFAFQAALVFMGCLGLLYLLGSIWVVHRLVEAGIVMSGLSIKVARQLSWRFWRHHWELLGMRFFGLSAVLVVGGGIAYGLFAAFNASATNLQLSAAAGALTLALAILTVLSGGAAEAGYRLLIELERPYRASRLLGGRRPLQPSLVATALLGIGLAVPLGVSLAALIYLR